MKKICSLAIVLIMIAALLTSMIQIQALESETSGLLEGENGVSALSLDKNITEDDKLDAKEYLFGFLQDNDIDAYERLIDDADTYSELMEAIQSAEESVVSETLTYKYSKQVSFSGAEILSEYVVDEQDTDVVELKNGVLSVVGIGRAVIKVGDEKKLIITEKTPIALVIISGQSNAAGDSSDNTRTIKALGQYKNRFLITNSMNTTLMTRKVNIEDAIYTAENGGKSQFASGSWLTWSAAEASSLGARLSDEWDMPVWVLNTGICARVVNSFDPEYSNPAAYTATIDYATRIKAIIEGSNHYILDTDKTGLFWLQGCSDGIDTGAEEETLESYRQAFMNMYNGWKREIGIKYAGIWLVRSGVHSNGPIDFVMSGPRLAQIQMGNSNASEYEDIYLIMNTDIFRTDAETRAHFESKYQDAAEFQALYGYSMPTTANEVKPGLHYDQAGYNELGDEAGVNINRIMNGDTEVTDAVLLNYDGNEATSFEALVGATCNSGRAVPMPKNINFNASAGLTVKIADETIATYDEESLCIIGVKEGATTATLYIGDTAVDSYPVTVRENFLDKSGWIITASSNNGSGFAPENLIDGFNDTYWKANASSEPPHQIEITLPEATIISGFAFTPYSDIDGYPLEYDFYVYDDLMGQYILADTGSFEQSLASQKVVLSSNYKATSVKFIFKTSVGGHAALSEFDLIPEDENLELNTIKLAPISRDGWQITASSDKGDGFEAEKLIDGSKTSYWVADLSHQPPHQIEITLPTVQTIRGFSFDPYADLNGYPLTYDFYVSDSDSGAYELAYSGNFDRSLVSREVAFTSSYDAKRVKFVFNTTVNGYAALSEFNLLKIDDSEPEEPTPEIPVEPEEPTPEVNSYALVVASTDGGSVTVNSAALEESYLLEEGTEVSLKAIASTGSEFKGWYDAVTGRKVSSSKNYSFRIYSPLKIKAIFIKNSESHCTVEFEGFDRVLSEGVVAKGSRVSSGNIPGESKLYKTGYTFDHWEVDGVEVDPSEYVITGPVTFKAIYTRINTDEYQYTVTTTNGRVEGNSLSNGKYLYDTVVKVSANLIDGADVFSYWKDSKGNVVSYSREYKFFVTEDVNLTAVYEAVPSNRTALLKIETSKRTVRDTDIASFVSERCLPSDFTLIESGIIYAKNVATDGELVKENIGQPTATGAMIKVTRSAGLTKNGKYILTSSFIGDLGVSAKAYMVYANSAGEVSTIYTALKYVANSVDVNTSNVRFIGRYYQRDNQYYTAFGASGIEFKFTGTRASISVNSNTAGAGRETYIHIIVDDSTDYLYEDYQDDTRIALADGYSVINLAAGLEDTTHTIRILKANESCYNQIAWGEIYTDGEVVAPPSAKEKKIQFFGDSITCGYNNVNYPENNTGVGSGEGPGITLHQDTVMSYALNIVRHFDADYEIFAQQGLSASNVFAGTSLSGTQYDASSPFNSIGDPWNHDLFTPDLIVQYNWINEYHGRMASGVSADTITAAYVRMYTKFLTEHPNAKIITVSQYGAAPYTAAVNAAINQMVENGYDRDRFYVHVLSIPSNRHPFIAGGNTSHQAIAAELIGTIENFMGWEE